MIRPTPSVASHARRLSSRAARGVLFCAIAATAAASLVAGGCGKKDAGAAAKPAQQPVDVTTTVARVDRIQRTVEVVGTLFGEEDSTISNKVNGRVIAIYADVGDRVDAGEPLAQLLRNDYLLSVNQKRAALLESLGKLGLNEVPAENAPVAELPAVRRADLQRANAEAKFVRGEQLFKQNPPLISAQDYEDLRTALDVAKSNYAVEEATARALIGEARTRLADLRVAEQALADTTVRAPRDQYPGPRVDPTTRSIPVPPPPAAEPATPIAGDDTEGPAAPASATTRPANPKGRFVVAGRFAAVGELFPAVSRMFILVDDDPLKLRAAVPERYFQELSVGKPVRIRIDSSPEEIAGVVRRINPQVDVANRTFPIEIEVPNADHRLPPGAFARGRINTREDPAVVFVPSRAVVSFAGNDKVFVIKDGKAQEVQVKLGDRRGDEVEVLGGALKGGEVIALTGTSRLANGVPVNARPSTQPITRPASAPAAKVDPVAPPGTAPARPQ